MKLLAPHELRQRGSRYFNPSRVHPFVVSFLYAIISLKRLAKRLAKKVTTMRQGYVKRGTAFLSSEIKKVSHTRYMAQYGSMVVTMSDIRPPPREVVEYRDKKTSKLFEDEEDAMIAQKKAVKSARIPKYIPRKEKLKRQLQRLIKERIDEFNKAVSLGKTNDAEKKMLKKIAKLGLDNPVGEPAKKFLKMGQSVKAGLTVGGIFGLVSKSPKPESPQHDSLLEDTKLPVTMSAEEEKSEHMVEYPPGAGIYYGASVFLQAKHGGYLSFKTHEVSTAAFKVSSTAKFTIVKSVDVTSKGAVCYGDAIWLCIGDTDMAVNPNPFLLGAAFSGTVQSGSSRALMPHLINHGLENRAKSSQYGRWIILNRDHPVEMKGKPVGHFDQVLLEQEWYYLASWNPGKCSIDKLKVEIDDVVVGSCKVDLLRPGEECVWKIGLAGLSSTSGSSGENKRAKLIDNATQQMKQSKLHRMDLMSGGSMLPLKDRLDPRLNMDSLKSGPLHYKESMFLNQKHLIQLYSEQAANAFSRQPSIEFIKSLYGKKSLIYQKKKEVLNIRASQIGIEKPPVRVVEIATETALDEYEDEYWAVNHALQIPTGVWSQMHTAMTPYYHVDWKKKMDAIVLIQRAVRHWLQTKFHFGRRFSTVDKKAAMHWHQHFVNRRRRLVFDDLDDAEAQKTVSSTRPSTTFMTASTVTYATIDADKRAFADATAGRPLPSDRTQRASQSMMVKSSSKGGTLAMGGKRGSMPHISLESLKIATPIKPSSAPDLTLPGLLASSPVRSVSPPEISNSDPEKRLKESAHLAKIEQREKEQNQLKVRFARSDKMEFGLPPDCFEELQKSVSINSGVKFLRSMSNNALFNDVQSKKRRNKGSSRPQTAL